MKPVFLFLLSILIIKSLDAQHLKGGWIQYEYIGNGAGENTSRYQITVRQYFDFNATPEQLDQSVLLGVFTSTATSVTLARTVIIPLSKTEILNKMVYNACFNPIPIIQYKLYSYSTIIDLQNSTTNTYLRVERCCREEKLVNVTSTDGATGIIYSAIIRGVINNGQNSINSNPVFVQKDTALLCTNTPFSLDLSATDSDNDSLIYSFTTASNTLTTEPRPITFSQPIGFSGQPSPPSRRIIYQPGYSALSPLGVQATIDSKTGIISGLSPAAPGKYVIAVGVAEIRNNQQINFTIKEIVIDVVNCFIDSAKLKPVYLNCVDASLSFKNEFTSKNIVTYLWDFGEKNISNPTSNNPTPTHTYSDSGTYVVKLTVTNTNGCKDSATAQVKIYPGFIPDFIVQGNCYANNYSFFDATKTSHGIVNSWRWDLGDQSTLADTSLKKDTVWKYTRPGSVDVKLVVTNSKGCIDTVIKSINILDLPKINLAFKDTLICRIDTLMLRANTGTASIMWEVDKAASINSIQNTTTPNPLVYPRDSTKYIIRVNENGCLNSDTVTVNVLKAITVELGMDTVICRSDQFNLSPISNALNYQWSSSTGVALINNVKYPLVQPLVNTRYYVTANLGRCTDTDSVFVFVAPYPQAEIGNDTTICLGERVQLSGNITGTGFNWSPSNSLVNALTLFPIAGPSRTTKYILTATDSSGCNIPATDTITIFVIPSVQADAGRDTMILSGVPLQLNASGGSNYVWRPTFGLNNPAISSPIANLPATIDSIRYTVRITDDNGCTAEDNVLIKVFKGSSDFLVPNAFTPNSDGRNDLFKPIPVGIQQLQFFRVYNRWGQLIYTTSEIGQGWDGSFKGLKQVSGTYVYVVQGKDYSGKTISRKGAVVLIR
jgi:gliding motility-associated-like protein